VLFLLPWSFTLVKRGVPIFWFGVDSIVDSFILVNNDLSWLLEMLPSVQRLDKEHDWCAEKYDDEEHTHDCCLHRNQLGALDLSEVQTHGYHGGDD
jgi:hypothetical protein